MHYEQAFEQYLRANRIPYVAVDEARKTLVGAEPTGVPTGLKSFDFIVYASDVNRLIDIKGRKCTLPRSGTGGLAAGRFDPWVTLEDVDALTTWQRLFGSNFRAVFVFAFWCDAQPPDALFQELFEDRGRWYALREIELEAFRSIMRPRSRRWGTVVAPRDQFDALSEPLSLRRRPPTSEEVRSR